MSHSLCPMNYSIRSFPICSNSCPLNQWCHSTISSSVTTLTSCLRPLPASGSFPVSQFFASSGQSIGVSASASVLPINIQDWFPLRLTGSISLLSKGLSRVFSNTTVQKHQFFSTQPSLWSSSHICTWLLKKKTIALTIWTFVSKVMSLLFNILSTFVIAFLPRRKHLLISCLQSPSAVILEPKKIVCHCCHCFPVHLPGSEGTRCLDLKFFECWVLSQLFHSPLSSSSRGFLTPFHLMP